MSNLFFSLFLSSLFFFVPVFGTSKFIVYSPPKCGTHLISKALNLMLKKKAYHKLSELGNTDNAIALTEEITREGGFVVAHNWSSEMIAGLLKKGYKVIFTLRDPRDQVISMQGWMREGQ